MTALHFPNRAAFNPPGRQTGAALVVAAIFLVVVIVVLGDVTLRLSATDVSDSSLESDAIDALFLAETGLEYTSQQFANGTACTGLIMGSPVAFGRGDFQVTQATDISGDCQVRVQGRVLFNGTQLRAQRTLEGLLSPQSGGGTWAVGAGGTLLNYDGSNWTLQPTVTIDNLNDITCAANECFAAGDNGTLLHWDGSTWTDQSTGSNNFTSVACETDNPDSCFAVGSSGIYRWDSTSWSLYSGGNYEGVYCATGRCYFVGRSGAVAAWPAGSAEINFNNRDLAGVACLPSDENSCFAVGSNGTLLQRVSFLGAGWWLNAGHPTNRHLYDINCPTDIFCIASGHNGTLLQWTNGSWSLITSSPTNRHLLGISCETDTDGNCIAVGRNGTLIHFDGSSWSTMTSPTGTHLFGVHVSASGGGGGNSAVLLKRWWEIIN